MSRDYIGGSRCADSKIGRLWDAVTVSADGTQYILGVDTVDFLSLHLHTASGGSLVAAVKIYLSDSYMPNSQTPQDESTAIVAGNWVEITSECVGIIAITGASAIDQVIIPQRTGTAGRIQTTYIRIVIDWTSGTGVLSGWWHGRRG